MEDTWYIECHTASRLESRNSIGHPGSGGGPSSFGRAVGLVLLQGLLRYYRDLTIDREVQAGVSFTKYPIHRRRFRGVCENKPQIAPALWERHDQRVRLGGNPDISDSDDRERGIHTLDPSIDAAARNRNHHHT